MLTEFFIFLVIPLILLYLLGKWYEHSVRSKVVHIQTGEIIPGDSLFQQLSWALSKKQNHELIRERFEKYGPIWCRWLGPVFNINIGSPELAKQVMLATRSIEKLNMMINMHANMMLGHTNLLVANGEDWKNQRKLIDRAFVSN
jgi:cytochrome P450